MTEERWQRISALLDDALEMDGVARASYLESACLGDAPLHDEVVSLLSSSERSHGFLDDPAPAFAARLLAWDEVPGELAPGQRIGPYRVVRELGRGGMGAVYLAERDDPQLRQRVAVKRVRGGLGSEYLVRRFVEERQILATLEHPGIARLVDGAFTEDGVPWFAMEYVEGVPIDRYCDEHHLGLPERIEIFSQVCAAVQYAHRRLVVHRDLKPGNILVTPDGRPKLLDFGIAQLISPGAAADAGGMRLLTPRYASPEQRRGEAATTAADVYALGVLLARLLTGRYPHDPSLSSSAQVLSETASGADGATEGSAALAAARGLPAARLERLMLGDLGAIVRKATHPEPERRYASVEQLAADLLRYARLLPVLAVPQTRAYRARRFIRRNRWAAGAATAVMLMLMGFAVLSRVQELRVTAERDRAQEAESFLLGLLYGTDLYSGNGRAVTVRDLLDRGSAQLRGGEVRQPEARAHLFFALGKGYHALGDYDGAISLLDSSYALERRLRGPTHATPMSVANQLADVLRFAGRYDRAGALYREILASRRREFGDQSTEVARSLNGLAMVLRMQGRDREAETLLREALAIDRFGAAAEPAALTQTLNNLGHVLRDQGRLSEAEALHRESLAARRTLWGRDHFEVSVSLANLAGVVRDRGNLVGADSLFRQALELRARLAGERHPDLASDRAGYALLLHRQGDLAGADSLYRRALAVHRAVLPHGHLVTATTLLGLGDLLVDLGRPAEAEPLLREALASRQASLQAGNWQISEARSALGGSLSALGRPEADSLLQGALVTLRRRAGDADPITARAIQRLEAHRARSDRTTSRRAERP